MPVADCPCGHWCKIFVLQSFAKPTPGYFCATPGERFVLVVLLRSVVAVSAYYCAKYPIAYYGLGRCRHDRILNPWDIFHSPYLLVVFPFVGGWFRVLQYTPPLKNRLFRPRLGFLLLCGDANSRCLGFISAFLSRHLK